MAAKKNARQYKSEFISLYKEGKSLRQIGALYNISKNVVSKLIKEEMEIRPKTNVDNLKEEFYKEYKQGLNFNQIGKKFNLKSSVVARVLRKYYDDVPKIEKRFENLLTDFIKDYENGFSVHEIAAKYNVSSQTVLSYIKDENVKTRSFSDCRRKYMINENYFDVIDSKQKAYQLALFFALAGFYNLTSSEYVIRLKSSYSKKELILKAIEGITEKSEKNFEHNVKDNYVSLSLYSKHLFEVLMGYEIRDNLDYINIPKDLKHSFFEGYFYSNLSINTRVLYIKNSSYHLDLILIYLIDDLEVDEKYVHISNANQIMVEKKSEINKIIDSHPEVVNKITEYIKDKDEESVLKWNDILKELNESQDI